MSSDLPWSPGPTGQEMLEGFSGHFLICSTGCCHGDWAQISMGCHVNVCSKKDLNALLHRSIFVLIIIFAVKLPK